MAQAPEGSPTFAIAHEYASPRAAAVIHIDFYRIRSEAEIDDSGITACFWERPGAIVIAEWISLWPEFERSVLGARAEPGAAVWRARLAIEGPDTRRVEIERAD